MAVTMASPPAWSSACAPCWRQRFNYVFGMQPLGVRNALLLIYARENNAIGQAKALHEFGLQNLAAKRVRARLKDRPEPASG